ncbi:MAG: hypothetical protein AB7I18_07860 [Candidatus Berkiella sp.]
MDNLPIMVMGIGAIPITTKVTLDIIATTPTATITQERITDILTRTTVTHKAA